MTRSATRSGPLCVGSTRRDTSRTRSTRWSQSPSPSRGRRWKCRYARFSWAWPLRRRLTATRWRIRKRWITSSTTPGIRPTIHSLAEIFAEGTTMEEVKLLIAGRAAPATKSATFDRVNPISGEVATRAAAATPADAKAAADAAAAAFPKWSALGPSARRSLLNKAADLLEARSAQFAAILSTETGATGGWGHFNVHLAAGMLREAAAMTTQISGEVIPSDVPGSLAMGIRQPAGVVVGIAPWNAPIILGVRAIAMPLACGNTVILKASEVCPATHRLIGAVLTEAGLGDGVVNVITHEPKDAEAVSEALISHPAVKRVNFTGSTRVGKIVAATAAKYLKPVVLELGGKAPLIVLDDADIEAAVKATVFGAFANSGQICMSTERVIVDEKVADEFAAKLAKRGAALPTGA